MKSLFMKLNYLIFLFIGLLLFSTGSAYAQSLLWAKGMGSGDYDVIYEHIMDTAGNVYVTGEFGGTVDFNPDPGITNNLTAASAARDIFLAKYSASGEYQWAFRIGGVGYAGGNRSESIALDDFGNVYIAGGFGGTGADFDPGSGIAILTPNGFGDAFLAKYDPLGNYIWAINMGSSTSGDVAEKVITDPFGDVYVSGWFTGTADFDPGIGVANLSADGDRDIFLAKYNSAGNYLWAIDIGALGNDQTGGMVVDGSGNLYLTGSYTGAVDFDPDTGQFLLTSTGNDDIFLVKYNSAGGFEWAKSMGGTAVDGGRGISIDYLGNLYLIGGFTGTAYFDAAPSTPPLISAGSSDVFLAKYDIQGNYVWAKAIGGAESDLSGGISIDNLGNIYLAGSFRGSADFNPDTNVAILASSGLFDVFLAKYDTSGTYLWAKAIGGAGDEWVYCISVDALGYIHLSGYFEQIADFNPNTGDFYLSSAGFTDMYLAKLGEFSLDGGVSILSPVVPVVAMQPETVQITIHNNGMTDTVVSAQLGYQAGVSAASLQNWSGVLAPGESDTVTFAIPVIIPNQDFVFKSWVSNINAGSGPDANHYNDTAALKMCLAMNGDYTVGDTLSNFLTLEEALGKLYCGGIAGPVRLLLAPGLYTGGYLFDQIPGMSTHGLTITSRNGVANDVVFNGLSEGSNILLKGLTNFKLDKISVRNTLPVSDLRTAINVEDCSQITISGCVLEGELGSTDSDNRLIYVTGNSSFINIKNNTLMEGYYGVYSAGSGERNNLQITGNRLHNIYRTPILIQGASTSIPATNIDVVGNLIDNRLIASVPTSGRGIDLTNTSRVGIYNNIIRGKIGQVSLYLSNFSGDSLQPNLVYNNIVDVQFTSIAPKALQLASNSLAGTDYVEVYHNSFRIQVSTASSTQNGIFYIQGGSSTDTAINKIIFINNTLHVSSGHSSGNTPVSFRSWHFAFTHQANVLISDHNNYYFPTSAEFANVSGGLLITLADWRAAFSQDVNSFQLNPQYDTTELVPVLNSPLRNAGAPISGIMHDINSYVRSLTTPTIGAHELCQIAFVPAAVSICSGSSFTFGTQTLTTAGNYSHTFTAGNGGCDSTVNLTLTVITPDSVQQTAIICRGTNYTFDGQQLSTAGTYYASFTNTAGCDSVAILQLQVQGDSVQTAVAICAGDSYTFGSQQLTTAGTYNHTFSTSANCDSVVTLTLTINSILTSSLSAAICPGSSYSFAGQQLTTAGTYRDTLLSLNGCDSVITLTLSVNPAHNHTATASICPGGSYSFGGQTLTTAGTFNHTFQNSFGCDSTVALTLSLNPIHTITTTASICPGSAYNFGGQTLTTAGTYNHTFQNSFGCDSAVALTLSIDTGLSPTRTINATICHGSSFSFAGQIYTAAGSYTRLISGISCDSLITIQLAVTMVDTAISVAGFTFTGQAANASYVWVDCSDWLQVPGSSGNSFTATVDGSYAAIITQNGCTDTSSCYEILGVGIAEPAGLKALQLYPNPSNGIVYLSFELEKTTLIQLKVRDSQGRLVYERQHSETQGSTVLELPLEQLAEGIYTVLLETPQGTTIRKLVKTK